MVLRTLISGLGVTATLTACAPPADSKSDVPRTFVVTGAKTFLDSGDGSGCSVGAERLLIPQDREFKVTKYMLITYDDALVAADRRNPEECPEGAVGRINRSVLRFKGFKAPSLGDYQKAERECKAEGGGGKACSKLGNMRQSAIELRDEYEKLRLGGAAAILPNR